MMKMKNTKLSERRRIDGFRKEKFWFDQIILPFQRCEIEICKWKFAVFFEKKFLYLIFKLNPLEMKKIVLFILALSFNYGFCQDSNNDYIKTSLVQLKQTAPEFSFTTSDGKKAKLSDFKGKVILINFFATWCGPCLQEMPLIENEIWNKLKDNPDFVLLSLGRDHSQAEIDKFIEQKKFTFPIYGR